MLANDTIYGMDIIQTLSVYICPAAVISIKNEYKAYACTFSSVFTYMYMVKYKEDANVAYAADYCSSLDDLEI